MENNISQQPPNSVSTTPQIIQLPPTKQVNPVLMMLGGLVLLIVGLGSGYYIGANLSTQFTPSLPTETLRVQDTQVFQEPLEPAESASTIDIDFDLPGRLASNSKLKRVVIGPNEVQTGTLVCWVLSDYQSPLSHGSCDSNPYFSIQANSIDFSYPRGGSFLDLQGFVYEDGKYRMRFVGERLIDEFAQENITEIENNNGVEGIMIRQAVNPEDGPTVSNTLNNRIGALFNTNNEKFPGVAMIFETENGLTEEEIDQVLQTFKIVEN